MPNMPKQSGDAVLSRDGTVKIHGTTVGFWRLESWEEVMRIYHFSLSKDQEPVVSELFKHHFKARIPEYLASIGKLPIEST